ncbi:MAG TPA: lysylphosphatidylglycerol synthase transmembrane domain-containing protein [Thermoleophilaceae bacterium]
MARLREHPIATTAFAFLLAAATVAAIAGAYGFGRFADAWTHLEPAWIVLSICASLLAPGAYVLAYRAVARAHGGPELEPGMAARVVAAGFGPFAVGGGFALDKRALQTLDSRSGRAATVRVLGLGALEWSLLAPVAWLSAIVLLITGRPHAMPSLLWPWIIAVPIGFGIGLWLAAPSRRDRFTAPGRPLARLGLTLRGVGVLHLLARDIATCWIAWAGAALYWILEIAAFYGALRFVGLHPGAWATILAYATGYALTRRSLPLGGAGATEALMTFALHWVGLPVPSALAAVVVYRSGNFVLPMIPALMARRHVKPLIDAAEDDGSERTAAGRQRSRAFVRPPERSSA